MVALLSIWLNLPFTFIILYAARLAIPGDLYEAALVDGTTPLQSFRHVTLAAAGAGDPDGDAVSLHLRLPSVFRGLADDARRPGAHAPKLSPCISITRRSATMRSAPAAATGWLMVAVSLLLAAGYIWGLRREMANAALSGSRSASARRSRSRRSCCGRCCRSPSSSLSSFKPARDIFAVPPRITFAPTLQHYADLWLHWGGFFIGLLQQPDRHRRRHAARRRPPACWPATPIRAHRSRAMARSATFLIAVRLIPPIVITLPLFPIVNWLRLNDTHVILIVLYATFFVSLGTLLMRTFIDQIPRELDEAALVDGAGRFRRSLAHHHAAGDPGHAGGGGVRHRVRLERIPVRLHLHLDARQDRAARDRRR